METYVGHTHSRLQLTPSLHRKMIISRGQPKRRLNLGPISNDYLKRLSQKANLDKENLSNHRPISNLSFLSTLTERIVLARLKDYLSSNSLLNPYQSGFTKHHTTETLLVSLYNKLVSAVSHQQVS